jgi:NAD(P)-dependent dehydrogenase (short-subunit alcohol dehydrogenase family)
LRLKDKVALVTGAARGIGRGIAEVFAREGAHVAVNDVDLQQAEQVAARIARQGRRAIAVQADVAKRAEVEADGRARVAGSRADRHPRQQRRHRDDRAVPRAHRRAVDAARRRESARRLALLAGLLPPALAEGRAGSIVNIGSIQAAKVLPGRTHYAPTKLGLEALTRNMSAEMTPQGIRVNCIHPGLIDTTMTEWVMKNEEILPVVLAQISLGRAGQPHEIGNVAAFFASDEASYLTGQSIFVDGGWQGK